MSNIRETVPFDVSHLSKKYSHDLRRSLRYAIADVGREFLQRRDATEAGLRPGEFWAVDDVSFHVNRGEAFAILGFNGSGKSTLLKILYGLIKADRGEFRISGTVHAIVELGTGFDPALTGRENIENGAILQGLDRRQTRELTEKVIDFAELGDFIDGALQSYSSGMKARLAYALSAHLSPDVLLLDEVLAVGDVAFQRKCINHMRGYLERGGIILFVSHNTYQVQALCQRGILLDHGRVKYSGSAVEALNRMHEAAYGEKPEDADGQPVRAAKAPPVGPIVIEDAVIEAPGGGDVMSGEPVHITVRYRADERLNAAWGFAIWTYDQWTCVTADFTPSPRILEKGIGELRCRIPRLSLLAGRFIVRVAIVEATTLQPLALLGWEDSGIELRVHARAGIASNAKTALGQLVAVDVEWA